MSNNHSNETMMKPSNTIINPSDESSSDSLSARDDEKTIPFLRRLTDMLMENEDVISFNPGYRKNGEKVLGKIVVHDRVKVESSILPRYFNHSSFASLRRQLNYFSFTRIGKGRQRGATYCNEGVVELLDILTLKRRSVVNQGAGSGSGAVESNSVTPAAKVDKMKSSSKGFGERRPSYAKKTKDLVTSSKKKNTKRHRISISSDSNQTPLGLMDSARMLLPRVSPVDHLVGGDDGPPTKRISLDLTGASANTGPPRTIYTDLSSLGSSFTNNGFGDDDIRAGCEALLCFSRGTSGIPSR